MDRDRAVGAADAVLRSRNGVGPLYVPIHPGGNAWKKCPTHAGHCSMFRGVPENGSGWRECDVVRGALAFPVSTPFLNICRISLFRSCPKPVGRTWDRKTRGRSYANDRDGPAEDDDGTHGSGKCRGGGFFFVRPTGAARRAKAGRLASPV